MDCTVVLQAGGASRRMGQDKGKMEFAGQPLILRIATNIYQHLRKFDKLEWILITNGSAQDYTFLTGLLPFRIVGDVLPGKGALGGLFTAFSVSKKKYTAVVACDLPFADPALIVTGCEYLEKTCDDVFIPATTGGLEPMHAVYRREPCLEAVRSGLERGERKAISWLANVHTHIHIAENEITFINVNTPEELSRAEAIALSLADGLKSNRMDEHNS